MTEAEKLLQRAKSKEHSNDIKYWEDLISDIRIFLSEEHPEKEKLLLRPIGALEMAYMKLSAAQRKNK